ncbi:protein phosphatase 2C domain-containing protein [Nocardioides sp.]|uniref:PP2C family protein-serine/threonine phosphatase n=1 Tax=Nocardioides sp. TaxID=35761 RepID=UPI00263521A9|nr:protein phosphatase 2C domain-containing protein [Nocardioides sp.]
MLQFRTAAASHVGLVRSHNEDSGLSGPSLVVVADGMGGAAAGEVASSTSVRIAEDALRDGSDLAPADLLEQVVDRARAEIREAVTADPSLAGMGTTFTAVHTDGTRTAIAHLGDSRAYLWRRQVLEQVTHDHTLVQAMVDAGKLSRAQARRSAHRHIVMRSLGGGGLSEPDLSEIEVVPGDRLLMCSDGLSDLVDDATLALILAVPHAETVVELLVAAALDAGGVDNVTCLVVDVVDATAEPAARSGPVERWGAVAELGVETLPELRKS